MGAVGPKPAGDGVKSLLVTFNITQFAVSKVKMRLRSISYFGTWTIDDASKTMIQHVDLADDDYSIGA